MNKQELFDKFIEIMGTFAQIKWVVALRDGCIITTPFTICGSVFLLIANLPIAGYPEFMAGLFGPHWTDSLNAVAGATFGVLALIIVAAITFKYVDNEGCDAATASFLSISTFLILLPPEVAAPSGEMVGGVIPKNWVGSNGVITCIFVAFYTAIVCVYCEKNHIGVKMPDSVPSGVARAFEALTPGMICFTTAAIVYGICHHLLDTYLPELFFTVIQTPLQGLSDTLIGGSIIIGLQSILFWAGVHGPNVVGGVVGPLLLANSLDNQAILDAGGTLLGNPQAHIITAQLDGVYTKSGGCGLTLGLLIAAFMVAKSSQIKSLSRMAIVPGCFNINEPIIFGLPIVFNPYLLAPFVVVPVLAMIITYIAISIGFMVPFSAVQVPWTTPPIIAGFLLNGWQGAVIQIINLAMSTAIYLPFIKLQDKKCLEEEAAEEAEAAAA